MEGGNQAGIHFPDGAKLELDELIDELMDRAQGVKRAQGRLRALLHANEMVTGQLDLDDVLRHIVQAACELSGARYGALGVIAHDGGLERFIHVGIGAEQAATIGPLPQGKGLLGALINDPRPIRLRHITDDERSSGFPANHPPMASFLGVPVRVGGEVFGNLYLTESGDTQFSAEDEELVSSLAVTAGAAISNARLYAESRLQQRWLAASAEIGAQLLAEAGEDPLRMIARRAFDIGDADLVTVMLVTPDRESVMVEVAVGEGAEELLGRRFGLDEVLAGQVVRGREPLMLRSRADSDRRIAGPSTMDIGPVMALPLVGANSVTGVLTIARQVGRTTFTAADVSMVSSFANHASVALELADARNDQQKVALLQDRDRIARDLHDHVIQQLFAVGLSLQGLASSVPPAQAERLRERVSDLDRTIRQIRTSIFDLRGPLHGTSGGTRQRLLEITSELTPALGFTPGLTFSGQVDALIVEDLADDVTAVVREALANIAKHAHASAASIDVVVAGAEMTVTVTDNGTGMPSEPRTSGIANLRARARGHGGSLDIAVSPIGGTQLIWKACLR